MKCERVKLPNGPCSKGGSYYGCSTCRKCDCCYEHNFSGTKSYGVPKFLPMIDVLEHFDLDISVKINGINITGIKLVANTSIPTITFAHLVRGALLDLANNVPSDIEARISHKVKRIKAKGMTQTEGESSVKN